MHCIYQNTMYALDQYLLSFGNHMLVHLVPQEALDPMWFNWLHSSWSTKHFNGLDQCHMYPARSPTIYDLICIQIKNRPHTRIADTRVWGLWTNLFVDTIVPKNHPSSINSYASIHCSIQWLIVPYPYRLTTNSTAPRQPAKKPNSKRKL